MKLKKMRWFLPNSFNLLEYIIKPDILSSPWFIFIIYDYQNTRFISPCKVLEVFLQKGLTSVWGHDSILLYLFLETVLFSHFIFNASNLTDLPCGLLIQINGNVPRQCMAPSQSPECETKGESNLSLLLWQEHSPGKSGMAQLLKICLLFSQTVIMI